MIMLMGFKTYDDHDTEYSVSGEDLVRLAALIGHGLVGKGGYAIVTIFHEGVDDHDEVERVKGERPTDGQPDLFHLGPAR